jgi:hydrogenase 3 maturation protease
MNALSRRISGKVVLAGVGCLGRGDDGFGPVLVRRLAGVACMSTLDCGDRLEDFTGDIAQQRPDTVLIADAVEMGASPGDVALLEAEDLPLGTGDTHRAPLRAVMEYLTIRTGATVLLLGVQPAHISDARELSPQVLSSVDCLEKFLRASHLCSLDIPAGFPVIGNGHER